MWRTIKHEMTYMYNDHKRNSGKSLVVFFITNFVPQGPGFLNSPFPTLLIISGICVNLIRSQRQSYLQNQWLSFSYSFENIRASKSK